MILILEYMCEYVKTHPNFTDAYKRELFSGLQTKVQIDWCALKPRYVGGAPDPLAGY